MLGCTPTKPVQPVQTVVTGCQAFPWLTASRQDTAETRQEIDNYTTIWLKLCGPAPITGSKP